jgi:site-specific DNA-methyltransferase (adenine-specific)
MNEQFAVQDVAAPDGRIGNRFYKWQKPDDLAERFIRHSTKPGDLVVDPFAGSGTFLLAAARLGRNAVGCELDEETLEIAVRRGCGPRPWGGELEEARS